MSCRLSCMPAVCCGVTVPNPYKSHDQLCWNFTCVWWCIANKISQNQHDGRLEHLNAMMGDLRLHRLQPTGQSPKTHHDAWRLHFWLLCLRIRKYRLVMHPRDGASTMRLQLTYYFYVLRYCTLTWIVQYLADYFGEFERGLDWQRKRRYLKRASTCACKYGNETLRDFELVF